jgi:hypothetical protein
MSARIGVFAGPSLPAADRFAHDGLTYLPSAARGDVVRAAAQFDALLLIDGVFLEDLAPSPKEMLAACRRVPAFGAASIGALRAVECAPFGAHPLGTIARWYASGTIDGDDEVAVVFDPRSERALSVPLVNVRYFLWLARRAHLLAAQECAAIFAVARSLFYADRTWEEVIEPIAPLRREALLALAYGCGDLKRLDARTALRAVGRRYGYDLFASVPCMTPNGR